MSGILIEELLLPSAQKLPYHRDDEVKCSTLKGIEIEERN